MADDLPRLDVPARIVWGAADRFQKISSPWEFGLHVQMGVDQHDHGLAAALRDGRGARPAGAFGRVLPRRRTPWVAIVFTTLIAAGLILTGVSRRWLTTTVVLSLVVFAIVNVSVLVLRSEVVDREHLRAPTVVPVLGAIVSLVLITQNEAGIFLRRATPGIRRRQGE